MRNCTYTGATYSAVRRPAIPRGFGEGAAAFFLVGGDSLVVEDGLKNAIVVVGIAGARSAPSQLNQEISLSNLMGAAIGQGQVSGVAMQRIVPARPGSSVDVQPRDVGVYLGRPAVLVIQPHQISVAGQEGQRLILGRIGPDEVTEDLVLFMAEIIVLI